MGPITKCSDVYRVISNLRDTCRDRMLSRARKRRKILPASGVYYVVAYVMPPWFNKQRRLIASVRPGVIVLSRVLGLCPTRRTKQSNCYVPHIVMQQLITFLKRTNRLCKCSVFFRGAAHCTKRASLLSSFYLCVCLSRLQCLHGDVAPSFKAGDLDPPDRTFSSRAAALHSSDIR